MRIAFIDNVSSAAFTAVPPPFPVDWRNETPTGAYEAIMGGQCDAGLLSSVRLIDAAHRFEPLDAFGIGCRGAVRSVLFFGRRPLRVLLEKGAPIALPTESQTARALFHLLCLRTHGIAPNICPESPGIDGILHIGNRALDTTLAEYRWPVLLDLGQWWFDEMHLPFVFAHWVVRHDLGNDQKRQLALWLDNTLRVSATPQGRVRMAARHPGVFESPLQADFYFDRLQHRLTLEHLGGLRTFQQLVRASGMSDHGVASSRRDAPCEQTA